MSTMRLSVHLLVSCIVLLFNFNAGFATKSFSFRKFLPFANKVTRSTISDQPVQSNNKDNSTDATTEALRESIKNFGEPPLNELEVMGWWDGVMSSLVDQYSIGFLPRCTQFTKKDQFETEKHLVLVECRKRMQMIQALVNNADLSYENYLQELQIDLEDVISRINFEDNSTSQMQTRSKWDEWIHSKWFQRTKWVAAQALMLLYNFGQYEVHRRLAKRAAEKRLAEVPEFPLLVLMFRDRFKVDLVEFSKTAGLQARRGYDFSNSSRRSAGEHQTASGKQKTASGQKSLEEANLRLVQYEIAEREACKVISSMCVEAAKRLDIIDTEYEIDDILSGILVLGNLYKRVGNEKVTMETTIEQMKSEYNTLETEKNFMIDRLETAILRLQMENNKLQENITEMKLKHNHKLMIAMKEIHEHQEQSEMLKNEKAQLETKLQHQERRLMEVPRMEEQYQRNARGIVRQQEVANTLKEIGWKKLEGEVKSMNFWKSQAKSLEETVARQKAELDNLNAQGRLNLSRYQSLLLSYQTLKRSHPHDDYTMHNAMTSNSRPGTAGANGRLSGGTPGKEGSKRPGSAPVCRNNPSADHINAHTEELDMTTTGANTTVTGSTADPTTACASSAALHHTSVHTSHDLPHHDQRHSHQQQQPNSNSHHAGSRRGTEHHRPRHNIFKKTLHHISAEELEKLRDIIAAKNVIITKLSRKLSHARAYPLKGINEPIIDTDSDYEDYENTQNNGTGKSVQRVRKSSSTRMGSSAKFSALSAFNDGDDNASETASFLAEEEAHQQRRVEKAVEIQQMYNERAAKVKASNPPHIRAIREARSFSENVTKNIRRPQSAY